jgi:hypothetical protein
MDQEQKPSWPPADANALLARALMGNAQPRVADYIRPLLGEPRDPQRTNNLALALNVYPSTLNAYATGEAFPSDQFTDRLGIFFRLQPAYVDAIKAQAREELSAIRRADPKRALLIRIIGQAGADTTLPTVLQKILYASRHAQEGEVGFATKDVCEEATRAGHPLNAAVIGGIKNDVPDQSRKYSDKITAGLIAGFGLGSTEPARILEDIATRNVPLQPFGEALEAFARGGGKRFVMFCKYYKDKHHLTNEGLSAVTGIAKQRFVDWSSEKNHTAIDESSLQIMAEKAKLTALQASLLWHMARGDTSLPPVKDIIAQAKAKMAATDYLDADARHKIAGEVWDKLYKYCGFAPESFAQKADISRKTVHHWGESITPDIDIIRRADNIAKLFIPYDEKLAGEAAALLLSIPGKRDKHQLLQEVAAGRMKIGELVREIRMQQRHTGAEAAEHITYAPDASKPQDTRGVDRHEVTLVERGQNDCTRVIAEAYASYCGFTAEEERQVFTRSIMGQKARTDDAGTYFLSYLQTIRNVSDPDTLITARKALLHDLRNNQGLTTREAVQEMNHLLPEDKVSMGRLEHAEQVTGQLAASIIPAAMRVYGLDADFYEVFSSHFTNGPKGVRTPHGKPAPPAATPDINGNPVEAASPVPVSVAAAEAVPDEHLPDKKHSRRRIEFLPDDRKWVWRPESQILRDLGFHTPITAAATTAEERREASDKLINETFERGDPRRTALKPVVSRLMERMKELDLPETGGQDALVSEFTRRRRRSDLMDREALACPEIAALDDDTQRAIKWGIRSILFPEDAQGEKAQLQRIMSSVTDDKDLRRKALVMVIEDLLAGTARRYDLPSYTDTISKQTLPAKPGGYAIDELIGYYKFQADRVSNSRFTATGTFGNHEDRSEERVEAAKRPIVEGYFMDPRVVKKGIITPAMVEAKLLQLAGNGQHDGMQGQQRLSR